MLKISGNFKVATRENGVNGEMKFTSPDVFMKDADVAPFDEELAWRELVDVAEFVDAARRDMPGEEFEGKVKGLVRKGKAFFTSSMEKALGITGPKSGALAVQMDDAVDLWIAMDRYCRDVLKLKPVLNFQTGEGTNFIEGAGNMWDALAQPSIMMGLRQAFAVKWKRMVSRPQEMAARAIREPKEAPALLLKALEPFVDFEGVAKDPRSFTIYKEGCPPHPAFVAGHGTFSGVVYALIWLKYGLGEQSAADADVGQGLLSFAHCRSIAGVHFLQDNSRGFKLGVETVKRGLPELASMLGVDDQFMDGLKSACEKLDGDWAV